MQKRAAALAIPCPACSALAGEDCRFAPFDFIHHERRTAAVPDPEAIVPHLHTALPKEGLNL
jgi:hypothetical protein